MPRLYEGAMTWKKKEPTDFRISRQMSSGSNRSAPQVFLKCGAPVKLYYDLTSDAVVTSNYEHDDLMSLDPDKVDSFSIGRHLFVHLDKLPGLPMRGFYEQLYKGDPALYARREKKFYYGAGSRENRYVEKKLIRYPPPQYFL